MKIAKVFLSLTLTLNLSSKIYTDKEKLEARKKMAHAIWLCTRAAGVDDYTSLKSEKAIRYIDCTINSYMNFDDKSNLEPHIIAFRSLSSKGIELVGPFNDWAQITLDQILNNQ